jgi:uncharacterized protein (TIRG00374 family)
VRPAGGAVDALPPPGKGLARRLGRLIRPLLLIGGLAFVGYMTWELGPGRIGEILHALSWRLVIMLAFPYSVSTTLDTMAWRFAIVSRPVPLAALWAARLAGEAVNATTPTASVGGEPLKAYLVRRWVPLPEGLASVVVDKTTMVVGQGCFLAGGLVLGTLLVPLSAPVMTAMVVLLAVETLAVGGFVLVQLQGLAGRSGRILRRFGVGPGADRQDALEGVDRSLRRFYREQPRRLAAAVALHLFAYVVGSLEIYLVLTFLDIPVTLLTAMVIESFGAAVKFASFMVPGSLGALEGGNVAIFAAFGLGGVVGLSYTLIRRLREVIWVLIGLAALARFSGRPAPPS